MRAAWLRLQALGKTVRDLLPPHTQELKYEWPSRPSEVKDGRQANNWRLLLAIADLAGGHWPFKARKAMVELTKLERFAANVALDVLEIASSRAAAVEAKVVTTRELADLWIQHGRHIPWGDAEQWVADQLKHLGLTSKRPRAGGRKVRGYLAADVLTTHRALYKTEEEEEEEEEEREERRVGG